MLNPIDVAGKVEKVVSNGLKRKYYRFRASEFYGGIATADCVGCDISCSFCWNKKCNEKPEECGKFYSPKEVSEKLVKIAKENGYRHCRIGGGEPFISIKHLLKVLEHLSKTGLAVIIETNGILIGSDESYARQLSPFKEFLSVKVEFKGTNKEEFSKVTLAGPEFFEFQIHALRNLTRAGIQCRPSLIKDFSRPESVERLRDRLETINPSFYDIEEESLAVCSEPMKK
ncbi:MAG: radical SAM protein [Candidatus Aenigmatarchaeota archaeon]